MAWGSDPRHSQGWCNNSHFKISSIVIVSYHILGKKLVLLLFNEVCFLGGEWWWAEVSQSTGQCQLLSKDSVWHFIFLNNKNKFSIKRVMKWNVCGLSRQFWRTPHQHKATKIPVLSYSMFRLQGKSLLIFTTMNNITTHTRYNTICSIIQVFLSLRWEMIRWIVVMAKLS